MENDWYKLIRQAIEDSGLTAYMLSRKTGLTVSPLMRFMRGEAGMTVATAEKLAPVIGLELRRIKRKARA